MDHHFMAKANKGSQSSALPSLEEAVTWAKNAMAKDSQVVSVPIYELHSFVEREAPPISVKRIQPTLFKNSERAESSAPEKADL